MALGVIGKGMVQPTLEKARRSYWAAQAAGCLKSGLAWLQALIQNPPAAPPEGLRLGDLANLSWPVAARGERLGGGSVQHARLTELESLAGPSAASFARHIATST